MKARPYIKREDSFFPNIGREIKGEEKVEKGDYVFQKRIREGVSVWKHIITIRIAGSTVNELNSNMSMIGRSGFSRVVRPKPKKVDVQQDIAQIIENSFKTHKII
jgi:hypothetical protein